MAKVTNAVSANGVGKVTKKAEYQIFHTREDWTLFRNLGTLGQKAGVPERNIAKLVAKELADNALDAGAECKVGETSGGFYIEDDGGGIPGEDQDIASLFSIGRPLTSTKLYRLPKRGAVGNGLRVVVGAVLSTGGILMVSTKGRVLKLTPKDDGTTDFERMGSYNKPGARIEVTLPGLDLKGVLDWSEFAVYMFQGKNYKGQTSPYWYDSDSFYELIQSSPEELTARSFVMKFDGCSGISSGVVASNYLKRSAQSLDRIEADDLLKSLREYAKPVEPRRLGAVGKLDGKDGYVKVEGQFSISPHRGNLSASVPFVIEAWAERVEADSNIMFTVNKTYITGAVQARHKKTDFFFWGCGLNPISTKVGLKPLLLLCNVITPFMPITTDGKAPDFGQMKNPIQDAIVKAVKRLNRYESRNGINAKNHWSQKDVIVAHLDEAIEKASGGGQYRYSLRQLYYAVRPYVIEETESELKYKNFESVITEHEGLIGHDLPGIYRDDRGVLYHPHLHESMPLGTLGVEEYQHPEWTFNKVLFIEKEGFFETLIAAKWPEKHDCALLTSKGFSSRAAKDIIDLLGDSEEELLFFCIHDADASGTMIFQTLVEATKARPERRVAIINLGLEPKEGRNMELQVEKPEEKKRLQPVANYVPEFDKVWLQTNRIELNAMSSPVFLVWLDKKMEEFGQGKLIPPQEVMAENLKEETKRIVCEDITVAILKEAKLNDRVNKKMKELDPTLSKHTKNLRKKLEEEFLDNPKQGWREPVGVLAKKISSA